MGSPTIRIQTGALQGILRKTSTGPASIASEDFITKEARGTYTIIFTSWDNRWWLPNSHPNAIFETKSKHRRMIVNVGETMNSITTLSTLYLGDIRHSKAEAIKKPEV